MRSCFERANGPDPRPQLDPPRRPAVVGLERRRRGGRAASTPGSGRASPPARTGRRWSASGMSSSTVVCISAGGRCRGTPGRAAGCGPRARRRGRRRSSNVGSHGIATVASGSSSASGSPVTSATVGAGGRRPRAVVGVVEAELLGAGPASPARPASLAAAPAGPSVAGVGPPAAGAVRNSRGSVSRRSSSVQPRGTTIASAWRLHNDPARIGSPPSGSRGASHTKRRSTSNP